MTIQEKIERNRNIILEYKNTPNHLKNITTLAQKYNLKKYEVSTILKVAGIKIYNTAQHTCVDETMFDNIDTEEKAY